MRKKVDNGYKKWKHQPENINAMHRKSDNGEE